MKKNSHTLSGAARLARHILFIFLSSSGLIASVEAATLTPGFAETRVATGLIDPVSLTYSPSDDRMFVLEKGGRIRVINNGALSPVPFLTLAVNANGDRGLFAMVLDPTSSSQFAYIYYTARTPVVHNRVSRFTRNPGNPDTLLPASELVLLDLPTLTSTSNNGGSLLLDGNYLYISTGDDGIPLNAQLLSNPFGKILRITLLGEIPDDNPFLTQTAGVNRAIWALGLRNPRPLTSNNRGEGLLAFDFGIRNEEMNAIVRGGNYGWPLCDGRCNNSAFINPIQDRDFQPGQCEVKAATIYQSNSFGDDCRLGIGYQNSYFYTLCNGIGLRDINGSYYNFAWDMDRPTGLAVDGKHHLWYLEAGSGSVFRTYLDTPCVTVPKITQQPQRQTVAAGSRVTLTAQATGDSDCYLSYQWHNVVSDDGPQPIPGATNPTYTFTAKDGGGYMLLVSNLAGSVMSEEAYVEVTRQPPLEAERLAIENNSGDRIQVISEPGASAGAALQVDANTVGDYVTLRLPNIQVGTYRVRVGFKNLPNSGIVQLMTGKIGGALSNTGVAIDLYAEAAWDRYLQTTVGTWTVQSNSDKQIRFQVVGKNENSDGYQMNIDTIRLDRQ